LARPLGRAVPDLGRHTAGDSTAWNARAEADTKAVAQETGRGLPRPTGGREGYTDAEGKVVKLVAWLGSKLHLLGDVRHEVALAYPITDTEAGDNERVEALVEQAEADLPSGRIEALTSDEAADDEGVHGVLHRQRIKPVIRNRAFWREEPERPLRGGGAPRHVAHDEAETVCCYDTISDPSVRHRMARAGSEKDRGTIKYRCPARHDGRACTGRATCDAGRSYGLQVRVPCGSGLRRFPPIPRATRRFERLDRGRTAVQRVDARPKIFWGADDGNIVGAR
jgi:hypothetical protein